MIVFKLILFMLFISLHHCRLPDKVYCANQQCSEPISKARTILNYNSGDNDLMSFRGNAEALIYMKSAGTNQDLWYAQIDNKLGFVSSTFLRENKIYVKNPQHIIPIEVGKKEAEVQPDKVQQAHEVVEGTTIYSTEPTVNNNIGDSTTAAPLTTTSEVTTPSLSSQETTQNSNINQNIWNQDTPVPPVVEPTVNPSTNVPDVTTPSAPLDSSELVHSSTPQPSEQTTSEVPTTEIPLQLNDNASFEKEQKNENANDLPPSAQNNAAQSVDYSKENLPASEMLTSPSSLTSGEIVGAETYDVPAKGDLLQPALAQTPTENVESNVSSSPVNEVNKEIPQSSDETNVPNENSQNQFHQVPVQPVQNDQYLAGNSFNKDYIMNNQVYGQQPLLQEPLAAQQAEMHSTTESSSTTTETVTVPSTTETVLLTTETISSPETVTSTETTSSAEAVPTTETIPASTGIDDSSKTQPSQDPLNTYSYSTESTTANPQQTVDYYGYSTESTTPSPQTQQTLNNYDYNTETTTRPAQQNDYYAYNMETTTTIPLVQDSHNYDTYTTETPADDVSSTPTPDYSQSLNEGNVENVYTTSTPEVPQEGENSEGFLSNMFSTISNVWPSTTEAPSTEGVTQESPTSSQIPETENSSEGFSFISYIFSTYNSIMGTTEQSKALFASTGATCFSDEYCDGNSTESSNRFLTFLLTAASSVLFFILGYYYIDNRRQDGKLIAAINSVQRDLLFSTKECEILREELASTKSKLSGIEDNSFGMDDMVQSLKEEINELKAQNERLRKSLDDNEKLLRVSENTAGELQNTLSEVENTLSELLAERANSEEQIAEYMDKIQAFEEELIEITRDRDNYQLKYVSAETALEESKKLKKQVEELNETLKEANNTIDLQKHEITALKDAIRELKNGLSSNIDVGSFLDHTEIKAKLAKALEERKSFEEKYEIEHKERSRLSEDLKTTQESLRITSQQATENSTRLEVLGKYFQERESELMKELNAKESLFLSKQGESASTVEKMELLQQEIHRYKEKCDALTLELAEQESARRTAVGEVEARAHAAWLEARAARREADAARDDAAALRRKLASLTAADGAVSPHRQVSSPLEGGVEGAVPLPPLAFLPPPLLPPLPRPPPLGRLPSPHPPRYNDRRYSPDSRYSPESRYSPGRRYSPETVRYSPDSRYSPRSRHSPYSPRRRRSREVYDSGRGSRSRVVPDTETEYNSDSPSRDPRRRPRYSRHSGPSSGSGCSSESDK